MRIRCNNKYSKKALLSILEHIYDDDYFYYKRGNWEDWLIMRTDVRNTIKKYDFIDEQRIKSLDIDAKLFEYIFKKLNFEDNCSQDVLRY